VTRTASERADEAPTAGEGRVPDVERAIDRIDERAAAVRERQVERALAELDGPDGTDPETRAAVRRVADRLTERLVATPKEALRTAAASPDREGEDAIRVALALFGD
jgi:glutamyl-tRNA reductase